MAPWWILYSERRSRDRNILGGEGVLALWTLLSGVNIYGIALNELGYRNKTQPRSIKSIFMGVVAFADNNHHRDIIVKLLLRIIVRSSICFCCLLQDNLALALFVWNLHTYIKGWCKISTPLKQWNKWTMGICSIFRIYQLDFFHIGS